MLHEMVRLANSPDLNARGQGEVASEAGQWLELGEEGLKVERE